MFIFQKKKNQKRERDGKGYFGIYIHPVCTILYILYYSIHFTTTIPIIHLYTNDTKKKKEDHLYYHLRLK